MCLLTLIFFLFYHALQPKKSLVICIEGDRNAVASSSILQWYQKPSSIRFVGEYDRTYISWISQSGKIQIRYYDNIKNVFSPVYTVDDLYPHFKIESKDDHNAPSLLILPDGNILIFYVVHDVNDSFFMKQTVRAEDISSWTARKNISDPGPSSPYNYPQARRLENGDIFLFYRHGYHYNSNEYYKISKDNGQTWESAVKLIDFGSDGVYALIFAKNETIHVTWSEALPAPPRKNVYYIYSPDKGITWMKKNKTKLTLPATRDNADMVFDSEYEANSVWDIVADEKNNPFIVFAYKQDPEHQYLFAQWDKASWTTDFITMSEQLYGNGHFFSGGIVIDPHDVYTVYLSKKRGRLEIEKWKSKDKGKTWRLAEEITKDSGQDNFRMQLVENYTDNLRLVWASGVYEGLVDNQWTGFSHVNIQSDKTKESIPRKDCKTRPL